MKRTELKTKLHPRKIITIVHRLPTSVRSRRGGSPARRIALLPAVYCQINIVKLQKIGERKRRPVDVLFVCSGSGRTAQGRCREALGSHS